MPSTLAPYIDRLSAQWRLLSPGGQRGIAAVSVLLIVGLGWALVYQPLETSLQRDRARIAVLNGQLSRMQSQAAEVAQIRSTAPVAATANTTVADVAGLQAVFGPLASVTLQSKPGGVAFSVAVSTQPYANVIDRLEQATARYRIRVASISLTRSAASSTAVSGDIVLVDAK